MWISKDVVRWHRGAYRTMMQAVCADCGHHGMVAGWINLPLLNAHKCGA